MDNLDNEQLNGSFKDVTKTTQIRATLFHFDGTTSQIVLSIPKYSTWSEYEESACMMLKEYCNVLAAHWVQIYKFIIETGDINDSGSFEVAVKYKDFCIPVGKVFVRGASGQWVDYSTDYQEDVMTEYVHLEKGVNYGK